MFACDTARNILVESLENARLWSSRDDVEIKSAQEEMARAMAKKEDRLRLIADLEQAIARLSND